jgi:hypothetical protein
MKPLHLLPAARVATTIDGGGPSLVVVGSNRRKRDTAFLLSIIRLFGLGITIMRRRQFGVARGVWRS